MKQIFPNRVNQLIAAILGMLATWALNTQFGIDAVLASASVSLCGALLSKKYHGIIMTASFAGMGALITVPTWYFACLVAVIVFILWVIFEKKFIGCGGKYGATACVSGFLAQFIIIPIGIALNLLTAERWTTVFFTPVPWPAWFGGSWLINIPLCIALAWLGAVGTMWVRKHVITPLWKEENTTAASALVGLLGFFLIWGILGITSQNILKDEALKLGAFIYMGSFAGMCGMGRLHCTGEKRCTSDFTAFSINGLMTGVLFLGTRWILPYGGLYGFTAFLSVLIYDYILARYILKERLFPSSTPESAVKK